MSKRTGREPPKSATIKEIAKRADVSIASVSYVLSGSKRLSTKTAERILRAARSLGYVPNNLARNLKRSSVPIIGVLMPDMRNPVFPSIMQSVSDFLSERGYEIYAANSQESVEKQRRILQSFLEYRFAGIIAIPTGKESDILEDFSDVYRQIPMVLVDRDIPHLDCPKILLNNRQAARQLTTVLLEMGHRRIGIIAAPRDLSIGRNRLIGYREALRKSGITPAKQLVFSGDLFSESGEKAAQYFLGLPNEIRPTAVLSCSDVMTVGFLTCLRNAGLRVPRDISLVSFDDPDFFSIVDPRITCVAQPTEEFGNKAASLLTNMLDGGGPDSEVVHLKATLISRHSVRPPEKQRNRENRSARR